MRYLALMIFLFISLPASAQQASSAQAERIAPAFISNIKIAGFVLDDKNQFIKLFKPHRNKYLSGADIDTLLQQLQEIYELAGFQGLVSIGYQIKKRTLTFDVALIK